MSEFNICIISDIHLKKEYLKNGHIVKVFFESFKQKFNEIHKNEGIDCLIISGDLAFKGDIDEYIKLKETLDDIVPEEVPILSVVGNHDVHWPILRDALGSSKDLPNLFKTEKKEFFEGLYNGVFQNFKTQFIDAMKGRLVKKNFKYKGKSFAGYYHVPEKNIILLLLNSSWKSFGPGVVNKYYDAFVKKNESTLAVSLKEFVLGDGLSQVGKQSYFLNNSYFPYWKEIYKIISNNPETKVLAIGHHPPSWLEWDEQFLNTEKGGEIRLDRLLELTDILITGHEHIPMISEPIKLPSECHNIQMGSFLDYHFIDDKTNETAASKFPNNWFSILKMGSYNCFLDNYKLEVKGDDLRGDLNFEWEEKSKDLEFYYKKIKNDNVTDRRYQENEKVSTVVNYELPINSEHISEIIKKARGNNFYFEDNIIIEEGGILIEAVFKDEPYIIFVNGLIDVYDKIRINESFDDLIKIPFFKETHSFLNNNKMSNISFYDFVSVEERIAYENFNNEQFIRFQSFKHDFFGKFKEFYTFKEVNINYDCFIINR